MGLRQADVVVFRSRLEFFADAPNVCRSLKVLREVGLDDLRPGQPATEFSGGEAQRVKLAELQRAQRGGALYVSTSRPPASTRPTPSACSASATP